MFAVKIQEFPSDGRYWRVDWLGSIQKNLGITTELMIQVVISPYRLDPDVSFGRDLSDINETNLNEQRIIRVGIGQLPVISIGSIWKNGICQKYSAGHRHIYERLNISLDKTREITAGCKIYGQYLIPYDQYRTGSPGPATPMFALEHEGDRFGILIPMVEVLRFYYAVSTNLSHFVFSGNIKHNLGSVLREDRCIYDDGLDEVVLGIRQHVTDDESWHLARMLNSTIAYSACCRVHDHLIKDSINNDFPHVKTGFPFEGYTDLSVTCKRIRSPGDGKWRYLVLSLNYCTADFPFKDLTVIRDNDGSQAVDSSEDIPLDQKQPYRRKEASNDSYKASFQNRVDTNVNISARQFPVINARFSFINGRKPNKMTKEQCRYHNVPAPMQKNSVKSFGTGNGTYEQSSESVQKGNLKLEQTHDRVRPENFVLFVEAINELNEMDGIMAAMRDLSIGGYDFVPLLKSSDSWQWSYLDSRKKIKRRVVAADIVHSEQYFTLVEIEARKSESFVAAIIYAGSSRLSDDKFKYLIRKLIKKKGIWVNIDNPIFPIHPLKHTWKDAKGFSKSMKSKVTHSEEGLGS